MQAKVGAVNLFLSVSAFLGLFLFSTVEAQGDQLPSEIRRDISITELGYQGGIELSGLSGQTDLYFSLPPAQNLTSLSLRLPYRSLSVHDSRRSLKVLVHGQTMAIRALSPGESEGVIDLPLSPDLVQNGFLQVTLKYSGALTEDICVDQRIAGDLLAISPGASLSVGLSGPALESISSLMAAMPAPMDVILAPNADEHAASAAYQLVAGHPAARILQAVPQTSDAWTRGRVHVMSGGASALSIVAEKGLPVLKIAGDDPEAAARILRSEWRAVAAVARVSDAGQQSQRSMASTTTFSDLGGDTTVKAFSDTATWDTSFSAASLPSGTRPARLLLDVVASGDGGATPPVVSVIMNGVLLGGGPIKTEGRQALSFAIPDGLFSAQNTISTTIRRQVASGECKFAPQSYAAQVLPSSHIELTDAGAVTDFSDLPGVFNRGVTVILQDPVLAAPSSRVIQGLLGKTAEPQVMFGQGKIVGATVWVSSEPPPDSKPAIRFDQGRVEVVAGKTTTLVTATEIERLTVVQLVQSAGKPVLWIKPGTGFAELVNAAPGAGLGQGDIALYDGANQTLAFSSHRDRLINLVYPDRVRWLDLAWEYRLWLILAGWVVVSAGFIMLMRRAKRGSKQS